MPGYVVAALKRFGIESSSHITKSPAPYVAPIYGKGPQLVPSSASPQLDATRTKYIQEVIGVFLYYARAVDPTMFTTLNKLASRQAVPTEDLYHDVHHFLRYAASYPDATVVFHASNMQLAIHSDASYLSESQARSRVGGYHYLIRRDDPSLSNGAIEAISTILTSVVASASEAEYAAMFINAQTGCGIRNILSDLGYPQPATTITSDNTAACGMANKTTKMRRSKAIDMRYHWIRDRVAQGQFNVEWKPGKSNLADYFTKTHPVQHVLDMRSTYVSAPRDPGWTMVTAKHKKRPR
jgi:hypothetical protein